MFTRISFKKVFLIPITVYFLYLAFQIYENPSKIRNSIQQCVSIMPKNLQEQSSKLIQQQNIRYAVSFAYGLLGLCCLFQIRIILTLYLFAQAALLGLLMFSIIATKPEMQELSEVLDKVAYQFVILGMIFTALADHSIKQDVKKKAVMAQQIKKDDGNEKQKQKQE